jgi:putative peptidoglycan lipid II flippase
LAQQQEKIVRSAGVVSAAVLTSRISGLLREIVMARLFGAGQAYDAFLLGFRIPNLTRDLFAEGALSSAFVPTFTDYLTTKGKREAAVLANLVATAIIVVVGSLCVLGIIFSPALVRLLASGFEKVPGKFELAVTMTRIMFPFLLFVALAAQAMGILNACGIFGVPAMASTFFNLGSVTFGIVLGFWAASWLRITPIEGMAYGVVLGGILQMAWQLPSLRKAGFSIRLQHDWSHPGLRHILQLMGPAILGNAAVQINVMVNTNLASSIFDPVRGYDGAVSWLGYSFRFMQLPLGLFGVAMASATLPAISESAALGKLDEFRRTLSQSLTTVFLLTLPSSVGLIVLGEPMVGLIYEGGKFRPYDTHQTAIALSYYAIGLGGYSALKVLTPAFYALHDARTPMYVSLASVMINFTVAYAMVRTGTLGHAGLALATSSVAWFGFICLLLILRRKIGGIYGRNLFKGIAEITLAAVGMGLAIRLASYGILRWLGSSRLARLADLSLCIPVGALVFYMLCRALRVGAVDVAVRAVAIPPGKWVSGWRGKI